MAFRSIRRRSNRGACAACALMLAVASIPAAVADPVPAGMPEAPRARVATEPVAITGRKIEVPADGDLRAALERARPGDVIELQPGVVYRGPFTLPRKNGDGWIVITTAGSERHLPPPATRVLPLHADVMAILEAGHGAVISAAEGAGYYRFVGVLIRPTPGEFLYNLVSLGTEAETLEQLPHHIIFDRCILRGDPEVGTRRGIALNARYSAVIDSHLAGFKELGADSQAIAGWNGPGPFKIVNNYLEGAGENVLFGGARARIPGLVPSDIEIRGNHFSKPLRWREGHTLYAGTPWAVKNLFELKNARRVLVDGNLLEYSWVHGQTGFAVLFTVRNEDGAMPWAVVEDVVFSNNVIRHAGGGISFLGRDNGAPTEARTRRILVTNNLFDDIGGQWGGGRLFQMIDGTADVTIANNTARHTGSIIVSDGSPHSGFVFVDNIVLHNEYGIVGAGTLPGSRTLEVHFPDSVVTGNSIAGASRSAYPRGNRYTEPHELSGTGTDLDRLCRAFQLAQLPLVSLDVCGSQQRRAA
ncbi:MAG: right-handed parallel beta-helix repeat-containing protein [Xanthomonadaceae bacterium]|nr:right-handed parallel beta-helix repeat-containing protein [Xanthomonadaceae bacterium]